MFRHFAAITVLITILVAVFADGEGREALAAQVAERQKQNALLVADAKTVGQRTIGLKKAKSGKAAVAYANATVDDSDSGGSYGAPMDSAGGSGSGSDSGSISVGPSRPPGPLMGPGPNSAVPPHERKKGPGKAQPPRPTQDQLNRLMEASRQRSGASE
jgi:hypothetical protein